MSKPLITFIMPCFNAQLYLAESIQSILNQTVKNIELIITNDCSTDASKDIMDFYALKDRRIKVIDLKVNEGMSNARNVANKAARASIIAVQDADDVSMPDRAFEIVKYFKNNPKTDLFYSAFTLIDEHNNPSESYMAEKFNINNVFEKRVTMIGHPTVAYKKKVILKNPYVNGVWSRLGFEDFRLITWLWKQKCNFGFINKPLVLYRWHNKNSSQNRNPEIVNKTKNEYIEKYLKGAENANTKDFVFAH
jgi:glycosyltransferase involved in cell wall biosynthesis